MPSPADDRKDKTKEPDLSYCPDGMRRIAVVIGACLALAGCGGESSSSKGSTAAPEQTVTLSETEFSIDTNTVSVDQPGTVAFKVQNKGQVAHALEVEGNGLEEETDTIQPGESATLTVKLEAGSYEMYCPIDGHKDKGMEGEITVTGSPGAGGGTTTTEGTTTDDSPGY
jgi:uncharacterized cupredoxin-like copper-binding protein